MQVRTAPKARFNEAVSLIKAGKLGAAESCCRRSLEQYPGDVNIQALLGAVLIQLHRHVEAEASLRDVVELAPSFAKPFEDLGGLLLNTGRAAEALPLLERATRLDPSLEHAWHSLGRTLDRLGRAEEAQAAFEKCFALSPERRLMATAAEHQREGRLRDAELTCRRILRGNPRSVEALRLLARLAAGAGHHDDAESLLKEAIRIAPDYLPARLELGQLFMDQDRFAEALDSFDQVIALDPGQPQAHFYRAATLARASFTHESIASYRACLAVSPDHFGALLGLGHVLSAVGDHAGAIASYQECRRLRPDSGEVYWSLTNLKTYRFDDATLTDMERRVAEPGQDPQSEVNFLFAIAKAWEDRGDFERAFDFYRRGNAKQRSGVVYDAERTRAMTSRLVESYAPGLLESLSGSGNPDPSPIFIVGLPRSGSTLLEQILASHSAIEGTAELPYVSRLAATLGRGGPEGGGAVEAVRQLEAARLAALGAEYLDLARIHRRTATPRFIDKMPNNFPNIGLIALMLPNAKIIDARRHPLDACLSCYRQLFAKGQNFSYDLAEIGDYYLQYQRMMDHWHAVLPGRVLTVQYEEIVSDFESQARRLVEFCGLPWEDACLRFWESGRPVRTPSAEQVRQPIYDRSVGHFRNYERHLGKLIDVIAPIRDRYRRYERA